MTPEEQKAADEKAAEEKAAADKAAEDAKKKKKFDKDQLDQVQTLINEGVAKAEAEAKKQLAEEKAKWEKEVADLKAKIPAEPKKEEPKTAPELEAFKAEIAEMKNILGGIKTERDELKKRVNDADEERRKSRKKDMFLGAVSEAKISLFDQLEAYDLAERDGYEWDKEADKPVVINKATGRPRLNENAEPMSVLDFVKDFTTRKKYLVKAGESDTGGTGSGGSEKAANHEKKAEKSFDTMSPEEFEAYTQSVMNKR